MLARLAWCGRAAAACLLAVVAVLILGDPEAFAANLSQTVTLSWTATNGQTGTVAITQVTNDATSCPTSGNTWVTHNADQAGDRCFKVVRSGSGHTAAG